MQHWCHGLNHELHESFIKKNSFELERAKLDTKMDLIYALALYVAVIAATIGYLWVRHDFWLLVLQGVAYFSMGTLYMKRYVKRKRTFYGLQ